MKTSDDIEKLADKISNTTRPDLISHKELYKARQLIKETQRESKQEVQQYDQIHEQRKRFNKFVAFLPAAVDACALYREFLPHLRLHNSKFVFNPGNRLMIEEIVDCHTAVVQRLVSQANLEAILVMKKNGLRVVYDLDDNLWSIPSYNPGKKMFERIKTGFAICAKECHAISVSTNALAAVVKREVKPKIPVVVLQNCIDMDLFKPLPDIEREEVIVGWGGSITHSGDTAEVFSLLPDIMSKNEKMIFELVGQTDIKGLTDHPRFRVGRPVPVSEYPARLASWRWDIFLAPLKDNLFNRSKSSLKIIEAGALKRPCLVSPVAPYVDFCKHNKELDWLVCRTNGQWKEKITKLVNDKAMRQYYGNLLYETVDKHYNMAKMVYKWEDLYENL